MGCEERVATGQAPTVLGLAQFDYFPRRDGPGYWLDCQTDFMSHYDSRFVIPLIPVSDAPLPAARLNPVVGIGGVPHCLLTQFAGVIPANELAHASGSLADDRFTIMNALDFLLTGV